MSVENFKNQKSDCFVALLDEASLVVLRGNTCLQPTLARHWLDARLSLLDRVAVCVRVLASGCSRTAFLGRAGSLRRDRRGREKESWRDAAESRLFVLRQICPRLYRD